MPIVHIYLLEGKPQTYLQALGDSIHQALMETWGLPEKDAFRYSTRKKQSTSGLINLRIWKTKEFDGPMM